MPTRAHQPVVSIIVPVLNDAENLARLLSQLAAWQDLGDEIIVVDGGSDDASVERARLSANHVVTAARGRACQMNAGAAHATGQILWFVHADSRIAATAREALLGACAEAIAWGRFDVAIADHAWPFRVIENLMNLRSRLTAIATGDQAIFVTRELFTRVGGFASIALMEDIEITTRLRRVVRPHCLRTRVSTSARRWRERGIVRTIVTMWLLRSAWFFGMSPVRLSRIYGYN